jgi:hypothetical protein
LSRRPAIGVARAAADAIVDGLTGVSDPDERDEIRSHSPLAGRCRSPCPGLGRTGEQMARTRFIASRAAESQRSACVELTRDR